MRTLNTKEISDCVYRLARKAGVTLTPACHAALESAAAQETGAARFALETVLENERTAAREQMPVCQDTGMAVVLIELGQDVRLTGAPLKEAVDDGVRRAYADGCFRKSICDPLTRENTDTSARASAIRSPAKTRATTRPRTCIWTWWREKPSASPSCPRDSAAKT